MQCSKTEYFNMSIPIMLRSKNTYLLISEDRMPARITDSNNENLLLLKLGNSYHRHRNIAKSKIEETAIQKYRAGGYGLKYTDLTEDFHITKSQAQLTLKHLHHKGVLFTARDLIRQGINLMENKKPQAYFPSCIKAEIVENLKKKKRVNSNSIEALSSTIIPFQKDATVTVLEYQKVQNVLESLLLLPYNSSYIHRLLLTLHINRQFYAEVREIKGKKKIEKYEEIIGSRYVEYTVSSNGTVQIAVRSNDTPFKLETEQDVSMIFSFFGQIRDRLLFLLGDQKELLVPSVMEWVLKQCDLNKDIQIDEKAQLTLPDIQLMHMDRVFRQYVKIIKGKAYYRTEESLKLNEVLPMALDNIIHPYKSLEKKIEELPRSIERLNQKIDAIIEANPKIKRGKQDNQQYNESCRLASNSNDNNCIDNGEHL
jgi:hypothetical protein